MDQTIRYAPAYAMAEITLSPGETVNVEGGSMVAMSSDLAIETTLGGTKRGFFGRIFAFFGALFRKMLGGETMFINSYTAQSQPGTLLVAPVQTGDIVHHTLRSGQSIYLQSSAYLASTPGITVKTKWAGFKAFFSGEGLFLLLCSGDGQLWFNSYGAIETIDVRGKYIVDTGHIVAFDDTLTFRVKSVGGLKATLLSGEGLVTEFNGTGKLYIQTHNMKSIISWISPMLP